MGKYGMSTAPRTGQTPSKATISKLSKAMGDPTKTIYGLRLGSDSNGGGAPADYFEFTPKDFSVLLSVGIEPKDPVLNEKLDNLLFVLEDIATERNRLEKERWEKGYQVGDFGKYGRYNIRYTDEWRSEKAKLHNRINELDKDIDENKAKEQSLIEKFQTEKMDAYAKTYMDKQLINQRPTPTDPETIASQIPSLPIISISIIAVIVGIFLLRRRA
mgnify:CR=1 FL=1